MAGELGWDDGRLEDEVDHYLRRVEAERQSQEKLTDQEADEARVQAPEGPWAGLTGAAVEELRRRSGRRATGQA